MQQRKTNIVFGMLTLASVLLYAALGYGIDRSEFLSLSLLFVAGFSCYVLLLRGPFTAKQLLLAGIVFRAVFLLAIPVLSQDYFRFIWDGRLLAAGYNPYMHLPSNFILQQATTIADSKLLYDGMGGLSTANFSNYPPLNQVIFGLTALIAGKSILGSVIVMRLFIILADLGIYFSGKKILQHLKLPINNIFIYFLNPLVIVELTGNLHFEGVMLCCLSFALLFLVQKKWLLSAIMLASSILVKLVPLMLLPFIFYHLRWRKGFFYCVIVMAVVVLGFLPFVHSELLSNYGQTISLWFVNFEFNASIYYLARAVGYYFTGYNLISVIGTGLALLSTCTILILAFRKKNLDFSFVVSSMLIALSIYFLLSTTVHPWYVISLVFLSTFTRYRFAIVWSLMVIFSYYAYRNVQVEENYLLLFVEYGMVVSVFVYELIKPNKELYKVL